MNIIDELDKEYKQKLQTQAPTGSFEQATYEFLRRDIQKQGLPAPPEETAQPQPNVVDMTLAELQQKYKPSPLDIDDYWFGERLGMKGVIPKMLEPKRAFELVLEAPFFFTPQTAMWYMGGQFLRSIYRQWELKEPKNLGQMITTVPGSVVGGLGETIKGITYPFIHPFEALYEDPYGTLIMWYFGGKTIRGGIRKLKHIHARKHAEAGPEWLGLKPEKATPEMDIQRQEALRIIRRLHDVVRKKPDMKPEEFVDLVVRHGIKFPATAIPDLELAFGADFVNMLKKRGGIMPLPELPSMFPDYMKKTVEIKHAKIDSEKPPKTYVGELLGETDKYIKLKDIEKGTINLVPKAEIQGIKEYQPRFTEYINQPVEVYTKPPKKGFAKLYTGTLVEETPTKIKLLTEEGKTKTFAKDRIETVNIRPGAAPSPAQPQPSPPPQPRYFRRTPEWVEGETPPPTPEEIVPPREIKPSPPEEARIEPVELKKAETGAEIKPPEARPAVKETKTIAQQNAEYIKDLEEMGYKPAPIKKGNTYEVGAVLPQLKAIEIGGMEDHSILWKPGKGLKNVIVYRVSGDTAFVRLVGDVSDKQIRKLNTIIPPDVKTIAIDVYTNEGNLIASGEREILRRSDIVKSVKEIQKYGAEEGLTPEKPEEAGRTGVRLPTAPEEKAPPAETKPVEGKSIKEKPVEAPQTEISGELTFKPDEIIFSKPKTYSGIKTIDVKWKRGFGIEYILEKHGKTWVVKWEGRLYPKGENYNIPLSQPLAEFKSLREAKKFVLDRLFRKKFPIDKEKPLYDVHGVAHKYSDFKPHSGTLAWTYEGDKAIKARAEGLHKTTGEIKSQVLKRFEKTETFTLPPQEIPISWKGETALVKLKDGITFKGKITGIGKNYVEFQPEGMTGSVRHPNATIESISVTKTSVIPPQERAKIITKEYKEIKNNFEKFGQYYGEIPKEKFLQVLDELKDELPDYVIEDLKKIADNYYSFKNGAVFEPNPEFAKGKKVIFNTNFGGKAVPGTQAEIIDIEPTDMPGKVKLKLRMPDGTEQWFIGDRETFKIPVKGHPKVNAWPIVLAIATGGLLFPALLHAGVVEDWDKEQKGRGIPWPLIVLGAGLVVWLGSKAFKRWQALKEQGLIDDATFEKFKGGSKADFKDVIKTKQGGFFKFKFRHYFWPVETFLMHIEEKTGMRMWRDLYRPVMEGMKQRIKAEVRYLDRVFKTFGKHINDREFRRKLGEYLLAEEKSPGSGAEVIRGYKYAADIRNVAQKYRALFDELARDFQIEHLRERYFPHRLPQEFLRALYEQSVTKLPKELQFWAEMARKGRLNHLETDALKVMVDYVRLGLRKKYLGDIYQKGIKMINELNDYLYKSKVEYFKQKGIPEAKVMKTQYATTKYLLDWLEHDVIGKPTVWDELFVQSLTDMWNKLAGALRRGEITQDDMIKHINTALNVTYASALGRPAAPIKNLTQFLFLGVPFIGYKAALKGIKLFLDKTQRQRLWEEGVKVDFPFEREGPLISGISGRLGHAFDRFSRTLMWAFDRADTFNRGTVYLGYDALIKEAWKQLKAGRITKEQFFKKIKWNSHLKPVKELAMEYFNKGDIKNFAHILADQAQARTQFRYLQGNMPRALRLFGRLPSRFAAQFGSWQLWYADLLRTAIKNRNWQFLAKMFAHGLVFAYVMDKLIGLNIKDWYLSGPFTTYSGSFPLLTGPVPQTAVAVYNYGLSTIQAIQGSPYARRRMKEEEWRVKRGLFFLVPGSSIWSSLYQAATAKDKTLRQRALRAMGFTPSRIRGWKQKKFREMLIKLAQGG